MAFFSFCFAPRYIAGFFAGTMLFLCACNRSTPGEPLTKTSLRPDSLLAFDSPPGNRFGFSPLQPDHVWVMGKDPFDLDLKTGTRRSLQDWLGRAAWSLQEWTIDPVGQQIWLACFDRGAVRMDGKTRQTTQIEGVKQATCFAFDRKNVWIGTTEGIWRYERDSGKTIQETGFPATYVNHLGVQGKSLIVNDEFRYWPERQQLSVWTAPWSDEDCHHYNFQHLQGHTLVIRGNENSLVALLTAEGSLWRQWKYFSTHAVAIWQQELWSFEGNMLGRLDLRTGRVQSFSALMQEANFFDAAYEVLAANRKYVCCVMAHGIVIFEKATEQFYFFPLPKPSGREQMVEMDGHNLYLLREQQFTIYNLEWLFRKSMPIEQYVRQAQAKNDLKARFDLKGKNFYAALSSYDTLLKTYGNDDFFKDDLLWAGNAVAAVLLQSKGDTLQRALRDFDRGTFDARLMRSIAYQLFQQYGQKAAVHQAKHWGEVYFDLMDGQTEAGRNEKEQFEQRLNAVKYALFCFDSLDHTQPAPDKRLYAEARILLEYCLNTGFFEGEACIHTDLAEAKYRRLLKEFPQSEWADNAAYELLDNRCYGCGGPPFETAFEFKKLAQHYPESELAEEMWWMAAEIAVSDNGEEGRPNRKQRQIARAFLDSLAQKFPSTVSSERFQNVQGELASYEAQIAWQIALAPIKETFKQGEPVRMRLTVRNHSGQARSLLLSQAACPTVVWEIHYLFNGDCAAIEAPFVQSSNQKASPFGKTVQVGFGSPYEILADLSQSACTSRGWRCGLFDFSQKGYYEIAAEFMQPEMRYRIRSSSVRIKVE